MPATPVGAAGSGTIDANGNAQVNVRGFTPGTVGAWSAIITTPKGVATVLQGGIAASAPTPIVNGGLAIGPLYLPAGPPVTVTITGGLPSAPVVVTTNGMESTNPDDVSGIGGMSASVYGAAQDNPANLLVGQVGPPLIENLTFSVPGSGGHQVFLGTFDVAGYGALLLYGDPPPASTSLWLALVWQDATGTPIGYSQIDSLNPKFCCVVGCEAATVEIILQNADSAVHNMNGLTIIPLATMPAHPELLIPTAGGAFPSPIPPTTPPATAIIATAALGPIAFGTTVTITGSFVWNGRAKLNVGTSSTTWHARLSCIDAAGVATIIVDIGNVGWLGPVDVELTSGIASLAVTNTATSGTISPPVSLIASS